MARETWMPVFIVTPASHHVTATVHRGREKPSASVEHVRRGKDHWQRIGTALVAEDGSLTVQLNAIPIAGKLVIRPPQAGEHQDPTEA